MSEDYLRRLTEAVERIADHLTKPDTPGPVEKAVKAYYGGSPQQETTDGDKGIRRPKQASRS